ncbi:ribonuclease HIII [Bacillus spongiae]|uniref:Ribonuclease HIII n=1 Tax=Bacillus spongiae TaxID=2683610 RepID=A0ABU8H8B6_9BACI
MSNTVIKCDTATLHKLKVAYQPHLTEKQPPNTLFMAKINGCTITAYQSGKVLFQGGHHTEEAAKWGDALQPTKGSSTPKASTALPQNFSTLSVIGSDEVGTGDFFGPMTVVSAYVSKENIPLIKELGVQDSKNLKDERIVKIAQDILHVIPYSLLILPNPKYNELQKKGMTQGKMKAILHNKALLNLQRKIDPVRPDAILIDQFAQKEVYFRHLKGQKEVCKEDVYFSTKGESVHLAVAAASILARYAFLKEWDKLSAKIGFTLPKGAGPIVDKAAARLIRAKGEQALWEYTKVHFANTEKAKRLL